MDRVVRVKLDFSRITTEKANRARRMRMGEELVRQVKERIHNGGDEESKFVPLAFPRPDGSTGTPLHHTGTHLESSIGFDIRGKSLYVGSGFEGARVHQFGTTGKGGVLKPIRPVHAKALFIPLTQRAAGLTSRERNLTEHGLVKGKDFVFAKKVEIPPRPFLKITKLGLARLAQTISTP